jgi:serine/threonine protein kinase
MSKYCCFLCPKTDYSERSLDTPCDVCGRPLGFPLLKFPDKVDQYKMVEPLTRGFYAATYVAEFGRFREKCVLKIAPKRIYEFFKKNFEQECVTHRRVAAESEHVVNLTNMFDAQLSFGDTALDCHVAVLDYIKGETLEHFLKAGVFQSRTIAQIAIDLFRLLHELEDKRVHHNDLHAGNLIIQQLNAKRAEAVDENIRVVAIDLGSVADESKSDPEIQRLGDLHWVSEHLRDMAASLLRDPDSLQDLDYRIASLLEEIAYRIAPAVNTQRPPSMDELIQSVRRAFQQVSSPWKEPLVLRNFQDSYNAQTLSPWYVPLLLVDPDETWLQRISTPGPQIIMGMRGCGKTMLLRALQFHARAARLPNEAEENVLSRISNDKFLALFVSATRLLDKHDGPADAIHEPYARLLVAYAVEAARALRHLEEINRKLLTPLHHRQLAAAIQDYLDVPDAFESAISLNELERRFLHALVRLSRGDERYRLRGHPATAFQHFAEAVRASSTIWNNSYVLFLLDDVSTRYLKHHQIAGLFSVLLFQNDACAFKLTSEAQTLAFLKSPGQVEPAREGRDLAVFDLGAEVYGKIIGRQKGDGKDFVANILDRRSRYYPNHPKLSPERILGDVSLTQIAENIVSTSRTSRKNKEIYHGITALARVCVGDIGDVISLYETILKKADAVAWPIRAALQSECFQDFCSRRLYDLNRRKGVLKDTALSFAEASHELLLKSLRDFTEGKTDRHRLRQYMSIYVRITGGDTVFQYERLRDLIDSGVFVFAGGAGSPRTKMRDSDPIQQFKLTYRKIYGLSTLIGLAESDRFELSGEQLEEWLRNPKTGKDILLRNLGSNGENGSPEIDVVDENLPSLSATQIPEQPIATGAQQELFSGQIDMAPHVSSAEEVEQASILAAWLDAKRPVVRLLSADDLRRIPIDQVMLGLGFEERTLESARRVLHVTKPRVAWLVSYREPGRSEQILGLIKSSGSAFSVKPYENLVDDCTVDVQDGNVLVDITGLAKPALFVAIRETLRRNKRVFICHTKAESYYPLDEDIRRVLSAERVGDHYALLDELSRILTGELGPYTLHKLLPTDADESRRRILFAFSSAKHERLLSLLDNRTYDRIELILPNANTPRGELARIAAEVAARAFATANIDRLDSDDLQGVLELLLKRYWHWYVQRGFNFELALTGSKLQATAAAALAASFKIAQSWYVRPQEFDLNRFTKGVRDTRFFELRLSNR